MQAPRPKFLIGGFVSLFLHAGIWLVFSGGRVIPSQRVVHSSAKSAHLVLYFVPQTVVSKVPVSSVSSVARARPPRRLAQSPVRERLPKVIAAIAHNAVSIPENVIERAATLFVSLDIEVRSVEKIDLVKEKERPSANKQTPAFEADLASRLSQAKRAKCDKDYAPKIGAVRFSGLMNLPFLIKDTVTDTGCKW